MIVPAVDVWINYQVADNQDEDMLIVITDGDRDSQMEKGSRLRSLIVRVSQCKLVLHAGPARGRKIFPGGEGKARLS